MHSANCKVNREDSGRRAQGAVKRPSPFALRPSPLHPASCALPPGLPPQAAERRGVLILVVLSLLFLFVLIAITYVLVATRQLSMSKQFARTSITGDLPEVQLNKAMMQVLRGDAGIVDPATPPTFPEKFHSPIGPHSLLESMYGPYSIAGSIDNLPPTEVTQPDVTSGQIVEFTATADPAHRPQAFRPAPSR